MSVVEIDIKSYSKIKSELDDKFVSLGFECHPFKVGWYNDFVKQPFKLPYRDDTLAFVVFSLPCMFERTFIPFLKNNSCNGLRDPIDQCMSQAFKVFEKDLAVYGCEAIHDFELLPSRRPKILAQTAAHVSGAAYYYQRSDVKCEPWLPTQRIYGVCVHPKYGGWFAIRGVLILQLAVCPDLQRKEPQHVLHSEQQVIKLLEEFNFNWQDWQYRDIVTPIDRYSDQQKLYFSTKPADRFKIIDTLT